MPIKYVRKLSKKYQKGGIRKVAKYGAKKLYKRYSTGGLGQVVKDVAMLKGLVNTEKKYLDNTYFFKIAIIIWISVTHIVNYTCQRIYII